MLKKMLYIIFYILPVSTLASHPKIDIDKGEDIKPIAIIPFKWIGNNFTPHEDIGNIVSSDLRNSGKFNPLNQLHLPEKPISLDDINISTWSTIGIYTIVIGKIVSNTDNSYNIIYQLLDISNMSKINVLSQNSYRTSKQWLRYTGHVISNEIFEKLTGIKGAFCTRIAFVAKNNNAQFPYELCISDYDGYNRFTIRRSLYPLMSPSWSPKGDKIAYVTFEYGHSAIVIQTLSNGKIYQVSSFPYHNGAPSFSPDGNKLAFALSKTGSLNIYVMDIISGEIHQITNNRNNNTEPTWMPDSKNLIYTSDQSGYPQVYKINIETMHSQRLTWEGLKNQNANVSNDGKFMVLINSTNGIQHLVKQNLITGDVQVLSSTFLDETPSLSPDGTMAIYSSTQEKRSIINLVSINGYFTTRLMISDLNIRFPAWSSYL